MRLGERLISLGWVTGEQVEQALAEQRRLREAGQDEWLGQILLRNEHITPEQLAAALTDQPLDEAS